MKRTFVFTLLLIVATASLVTSREAQAADFWTTKRTTYGYATGYWRVYCANNWNASAYLLFYLGQITCERAATSDYPYETATQSAAVQAFAATIEVANTIICPCGHIMTHVRTGTMWLHPSGSNDYTFQKTEWNEATPSCLL
jgi:hypothetical protein